MALINNGYRGWKVIEEKDPSDGTLTGKVMPNIYLISGEAVVPVSATITYNDTTDVVPSGGIDGDVWYNEPADELFKKKVGIWTLLTDRVINTNYVAPVKSDICSDV